jgi:hypothetical protein
VSRCEGTLHVFYICICTVTTVRRYVALTFLDQSEFKVMQLNSRFKQRIKGSAPSVVTSSFELNQRVLLLHLRVGIRT